MAWGKLTGRSSKAGRVLDADFYSDGKLNVNSNLQSENRNDNLGGRSFLVGSYFKSESHLKKVAFFYVKIAI